MIKLSIVILNYNTKELLQDCLSSIADSKLKDTEVIVIDNASTDDSARAVEKLFSSSKYKTQNTKYYILKNSENLGFAKGNNTARKKASGEYVLFLNSDTIVTKEALEGTQLYLGEHQEVGALTCKVVLKNNKSDLDTRRSFPTPWVAFTHFSHLDRLLPTSKLFAKYWYGYISENETHEIDSLQGAFFLVRKKLLDQVGWFDEDYFLDGEDIDLCWKIKETGAKIIYFPKYSIIHLKGASKGKNTTQIHFKKRLKFVLAGVNSMEIFYRKRMWGRYPLYANLGVILAIKSMKALRLIKLLISYL